MCISISKRFDAALPEERPMEAKDSGWVVPEEPLEGITNVYRTPEVGELLESDILVAFRIF